MLDQHYCSSHYNSKDQDPHEQCLVLSVVTAIFKCFPLLKVNTKTCVFKFRDNAYFTNLLPSDDNVQKLLYMMNTKKKCR